MSPITVTALREPSSKFALTGVGSKAVQENNWKSNVMWLLTPISISEEP